MRIWSRCLSPIWNRTSSRSDNFLVGSQWNKFLNTFSLQSDLFVLAYTQGVLYSTFLGNIAIFTSTVKVLAQGPISPAPVLPSCCAGCINYELHDRNTYVKDETCPMERYTYGDRRTTYKCIRAACPNDKHYWRTVVTGTHECTSDKVSDYARPTGATCVP